MPRRLCPGEEPGVLRPAQQPLYAPLRVQVPLGEELLTTIVRSAFAQHLVGSFGVRVLNPPTMFEADAPETQKVELSDQVPGEKKRASPTWLGGKQSSEQTLLPQSIGRENLDSRAAARIRTRQLPNWEWRCPRAW